MTRPTKESAATASRPYDESARIEVEAVPGKKSARQMTDLVADGAALNAILSLRFVEANLGSMSATEMVKSLTERGEAVNRGDFATAERMLNAQAVTLNAIFCELARRAAANMNTHLGATEQFMRLALKAQAQSRATLETLSTIRNPPTVFARQANINNGGQQQINNCTPPQAGPGRAGAQASESQPEPNKLLEASHVERLDTGAQGAAGGTHQDLATVGAINRAYK